MGLRWLCLLAMAAACPAKQTAGPTTTSDKPDNTTGTTTSSGSANASTSGTSGTAGAPASPAAPAAPAAPPTGPNPGAPVTKATLAEVGIEAASLDRSVDPCVDFYQFACGGWLGANSIPADRASWGRFDEIKERTTASLRTLLDEAAKGTDKLGVFYASCMNEAAIEKAGLAPVKTLLARVQGVKDGKTWAAAIGALHANAIAAVWIAQAEPDFKDSTKYAMWIEGAGLGLPDRDYYTAAEHADKLAAYKEHVGRMLKLGGVANAEAAAGDVIALETALAKVTKTAVERRDIPGMYNPVDAKGLAALAKGFDWKAYWKAFKVAPAKVIVASPKYFAALEGLRKQFKPAQWASYFTYRVLVTASFGLPKAFDDEAFALDKAITGVQEKQPRWKRCVEATGEGLGELLGKQYVDKFVPARTKESAAAMYGALAQVMDGELGALDWMTEKTRKTAQDKLAKLVPMVAHPAKWRTYDAAIKADDFGGNLLATRAAEYKRKLVRAGKAVDRGEWYRNVFEIDAYYSPVVNHTALLAGIMQPPFFGADRSVAANLGGLGFVIGHELTHGFDDQGSQFDAQGNVKDWWAKDDKEKFQARGKCVADQYGSFEVLPKQFVNGALTLGENIADLGGVKMAFKAYRLLRKDAPAVYVADGFSEDQIFFLATAQVWCNKDRPGEAQRRLTIDPHSPPKFRVYGPLRNLPEFAQAFSCAAGTPMRPAQTCSVW